MSIHLEDVPQRVLFALHHIWSVRRLKRFSLCGTKLSTCGTRRFQFFDLVHRFSSVSEVNCFWYEMGCVTESVEVESLVCRDLLC